MSTNRSTNGELVGLVTNIATRTRVCVHTLPSRIGGPPGARLVATFADGREVVLDLDAEATIEIIEHLHAAKSVRTMPRGAGGRF